MKLSFLGACGMVTGSSYLLESVSGKLLLDLGLFQGRDEHLGLNTAPLPYSASDLTGVVLTHAHLDHCGRLPLLVKNGFKSAIYMTEATKMLLEISLLDMVKVAKDNEEGALFDEVDVERLLALVKIASYHKVFKVGDFMVEFFDAGHILGSACVVVGFKDEKGEDKKILFSGDLGNSPQDLIKPTEKIKEADFVVLESTYGDRIHPVEETVSVLAEEIQGIEKTGGTLLVPAFSIERSQEILHKIDHLKKEKKIKESTAVFLDSPMAIKATEVFKKFEELYNSELTDHLKTDDPFSFPGLVLVEHGWQSKKIKEEERAKVIIAGSGMMTGGRILHHAIDFLPKETTVLLFVGYQAEETLGRRILSGEKRVRVRDQWVEVKAGVREVLGMSAHADQPKLISWLEAVGGVRKVFLTHGEELARLSLAEKIRQSDKKMEVVLPKINEKVVI